MEALGGWLFRHRTLLPQPIAILILVIPQPTVSNATTWLAIGVAVTAAGEAVRLWAVHHIGAISRTRAERLGPLIETGPFAWVRNPLYLGNIAVWVGFTLVARLLWLAPIAMLLLAAEYHAIVRWEERLLETQRGQAYRDYCSRVARWIPWAASKSADSPLILNPSKEGRFSWADTLFSERGTLIAIAAGYLLLWLKVKS